MRPSGALRCLVWVKRSGSDRRSRAIPVGSGRRETPMSTTATLFQTALNLAPPWQVTEVRFDPEAQELHLSLDFPPGSRFPCPDCGAPVPAYDTDPDRTWRHLNFFEHRTLLHARFPRLECPVC